ncbi:recombination mediator RecR [Patescibacteria group bacterium]
MNLPRPIRKLIESFERLPGVGPKTAARLTFYLLHVPQEMLDEFAQSLTELKKKTVLCSVCYNVTDHDPCLICANQARDKSVICVVEQPLDVLALEKANKFQGIYHVLHGAISPLNNIGPEEIKIPELMKRLHAPVLPVTEIVLATNPNMEGEATAMYIAKQISNLKTQISKLPKITRLGQGLPTGADLEYADELTLSRALEGRREY